MTRMHGFYLMMPSLTISTLVLAFLLKKKKKFQKAIQVVHTDKAPAAIGPYVQATKDSLGTVYVSGQVGFIPGTKELDGNTAASQATRALANMKCILEAANSGMHRVLKTTVLLQNMEDFAEVNKVYEEAFQGHRPARACFAVKTLPAGALVEIEAIALELYV